jgi:hypothetical protein
MPAVTRWPTRGMTRGRCRLTSATATFSTRCDTPNFPRRGSRIFGGLSQRLWEIRDGSPNRRQG